MASERDLELLDEYLTNRLTGTDKSEFELRLSQDPDLQSELNFHQQIAEGLRKARITELKNMLGKIPVAAGFDYSSLIKWTSAGAIATGIGVGLYLYFKSPVEKPMPQHQVSEAATEQQMTPPQAAAKIDSATGAVVSEQNPSAAKSTPSKPSPKKKVTGTTPAIDPKKVEVFDPTAEADTEKTNTAPAVTPPAGENVNSTSRSVVIDNDDRKYKFHYQLDGDNLTLYGDFEENLYTIMEFKSEQKQTVIFMFYKNNYYLLNQSPGNVNRLVPVNDPALLKRLREQRETN
jgi:hypothetical protein